MSAAIYQHRAGRYARDVDGAKVAIKSVRLSDVAGKMEVQFNPSMNPFWAGSGKFPHCRSRGFVIFYNFATIMATSLLLELL